MSEFLPPVKVTPRRPEDQEVADAVTAMANHIITQYNIHILMYGVPPDA